MTGATHGYNLRSKDKAKVEHCDQVNPMFESDFDESSVVPSTPRPRPSTRRTGRKDINVDPSESASESGLRILCRALMPVSLGHRRSGATRSANPKHTTPLHPGHLKTKEGETVVGVGGGICCVFGRGREGSPRQNPLSSRYLRGAPKLGRRRRSCAARSGVATPSGCEAYPFRADGQGVEVGVLGPEAARRAHRAQGR